jgi:hypothetical protein
VRAELEIGDKELVGHAKQLLIVVEPITVEYLESKQLAHGVLPAVPLYFPATQAVQVPPLGPVNPLLQVQLASALQPLHEPPVLAGHARQVVATVAPSVVEYVPATQFVHATEPVVVLYFPATHRVQKPLGPV